MAGAACTRVGGPSRRALPLALLVSLLAADAVPQQSGTTVTVRVPKEQAVAVPADALAGLTPLQELDAAWVAVASAETVRQLHVVPAA